MNDNPNIAIFDELAHLCGVLSALTSKACVRQVHGEIISALVKAEELLSDAENDLAEIIGGNNPYN